MSTLKVLILSTLSSILLTSCASIQEPPIQTEVHFTIPAKIAQPTPPVLQPLDKTIPLEHPSNFRILQTNMSNIKIYIKQLRATILYYETSIDQLNHQIESSNHVPQSMNK